jgi:hypothetical protein
VELVAGLERVGIPVNRDWAVGFIVRNGITINVS